MGRQNDLPPSLAPLGGGLPVAAAYLSLSPAKFGELVQRGLMPRPKRVDGRKIWDLEEVRLAFKALPAEDEATSSADGAEPNEWDGAV